jgi:hypothetical protein
MLAPDSELQFLVMEGISPIDPASRSPGLLQGADVTEYYGGASFESAQRVAVTQLKYSHRSPDKAWTAARLAQKGPRGQSGVIARLSELSSTAPSATPTIGTASCGGCGCAW